MTDAFQVGGDLPADSPVYIERLADRQAWDAIQRREYIMLLDPRQQGKTSLINQIGRRCEMAGHIFIYADLMPLFDVKWESAWYESLPKQMESCADISRRLLELPAPTNGATWCDFLRKMVGMGDERFISDQFTFRTKLRQILVEFFSDDELRTICFDVGLDYDSLPALGRAGKARELVAQCERQQCLPALTEQCRQLRPNLQLAHMLDECGSTTVVHSANPPDLLPKASESVKRRLVIAFDEIGSIPKAWATSFFAAIRCVHHECRERLTVILAGATDPREMISDPKVSPFNIAKHIVMHDFQVDELRGLTAQLSDSVSDESTAEHIIEWTGGQPYLSQLLCQYLTEARQKADHEVVKAAIDRLFAEDEIHIPGILDRLEARPDLLRYLCSLCSPLTEQPKFSKATNRRHFQLAHVIGILASNQPVCQVRNPIYERALKEAGFCSDPPAQANIHRSVVQRNSSLRSAPHPTVKLGHPMRLRYLHISDLHLTKSTEDKTAWNAEQFNQDFVTRSMLNAIDDLVQRHGKTLDLVFITGDVARQGKDDEYAAAKVFCQRLLEVAGVTSDRLFLVPGNHDVDRSMVPKGHQSRLYHFEGQDQVIELLGDPDLFPLLMRKFAAFNRFAGEVLKRELFSNRQYSFTETAVVDRGGRKFHVKVAGLNSALFAGYDGDDQRKLAYGLPQVESAVRKSAEEPYLTIALSHHPFASFDPADKVCRNMLMQHADLILTGHLHEPGNMFIRDAAGQAVLISAGASFETRESHNSFNVVEIDLLTGAGEAQFFKYLPDQNMWRINTDANPSHERGIFQFTIERLAHSPQ